MDSGTEVEHPLLDQILDQFFENLEAQEDFPIAAVAELRTLAAAGGLTKTIQVARIIAAEQPTEER